MNPIEFPESNRTYTKPEGWTDEQCRSLPTYEVREIHLHDLGDGVTERTEIVTRIFSAWLPTPQEIEDINNGKPIWLHIVYPKQMPVLLTTEYPFEKSTISKEEENSKKFFIWNNDYSSACDWDDFRDNYFECERCGIWTKEQCVCYAR